MTTRILTAHTHNFTPTELGAALRAVLRVGALMLGSGAASFRTLDVMTRCAAALGVERLEAYVTPTGIIASAYSGEEHRTQIVQGQGFGVDMNRIVALELLSRQLPAHTQTAELTAQIDQITAQGRRYSRWFTAIAVALACGAFAALLGGALFEFVVATIGAGISQRLRIRLNALHINPIPITAVCAGLAAGIAYGLILLFSAPAAQIGIPQAYPAVGVIASVLLLVPGVPLVTAILDLTRLDLVSGLTRGMYAIIILITIGTAMAVVLSLPGLSLSALQASRHPQFDVVYFLLMGVLSFIATVGFAVLFNVPPRYLVASGLVGMIGNVLRLGLTALHVSPEVATYCGALGVGLVGYWFSVRHQLPRLVFTVTGIIALIPGVAGYSVIELLMAGDVQGGIASGVKAMLITGAIAAGLGTARIVVDTDLRHLAQGQG